MLILAGYTLVLLLTNAHGENHERRNLAFRKPTKQSGTQSYLADGYAKEGNSSFAVDGILATDSENMTCSLTSAFYESWWMVDLGQPYLITDVAILQRLWGNVVRNFTIEVSLQWNDVNETLDEPILCYSQSEHLPRGIKTPLKCYSSIVGRYVRITKTISHRRRRISLCEFEVYGSPTGVTVPGQSLSSPPACRCCCRPRRRPQPSV